MGGRPADEAYAVVCPFVPPGGWAGDALFLTAQGALLGAIELPGVEPDELTPQEALRLAVSTANVYGTVPPQVAVTQYYVHAEGARITLRDRGDPISHRLSKDREAALNERGLARTRLVHVLTYRDPEGWNDGFFKVLLRRGPMALFDHHARTMLRARLSAPMGLVVREQELRQRGFELARVMGDVAAKWRLRMPQARVLDAHETWQFMKFVANLDPAYLDDGRRLAAPHDDLACALPDGDLTPVQVEYVDMLKLGGAKPRYLRAAAVIKSPHNPVGIWSVGGDAPIRSRGNFCFVTHFEALTAFQKSLEFRAAKNRLVRMKLDLKALFLGDQPDVRREQHENVDLQAKRLELERAEAIDDRFGRMFSTVLAWDSDPTALITASERLNTTLTGRGLQLAWEVAGLPMAYAAVQPGGHARSIRHATVTLSRAAAMSHVARSPTGSFAVEDLNGEEPVYVLETDDGQALPYSPYVKQRAFVIAVGPTRSGKTFFKNTISAHFLKYGGFLRAIDIDAGTETLARFFQDKAGLVRLDHSGDATRGLNPFTSAAGPQDRGFLAHMLTLSQALMLANDTEGLARLETREQPELDRAILATLQLPAELRSLEHMVEHLPADLKRKFERWRRQGTYDGIFNVRDDGIGALDEPLGVINLHAFRDDPGVLRPLFVELFFRITRLFEDPRHMALPKQLDIDEAHHPLRVPAFREYLVAKVRTWAKFNAAITLWTQSPTDYLGIDGWDAVRTAASTFIFLADGRMDDEVYKQTFKISDGICNAIRSLVPQRELFIYQPDAGVAKKCILRVESVQHVINTSHPQEVSVRDRLIDEHGLEEGLERAISAIEAMRSRLALDLAAE